MLFNFLWFLPCCCVSQLIQKPTEIWKGKKWEERLRKRERENGRMCLISASLLFTADCLRAAEPLYFLVHVAANGGAKKKKKRQTWETCTLTFLNQIWQSGGQPTAYHLQSLLIHNQKLSKWGRNWERLRGEGGSEREKWGRRKEREREMQVITSLFTGPMRAM